MNKLDAAVRKPSHYQQFDKEVKDIIRYVLGEEGYKYYCQGNELKYRLRAGFKDIDTCVEPGSTDLKKALEYFRYRLEVKDVTPSDPS
jgi:hypothetical protein